MILKPAGPHTFRMIPAGASYGASGEVVKFEVGADGRVTRLVMPNSYLLRK